MDEHDLQDLLDNIAGFDGRLTMPRPDNEVKYDLRALNAYSERIGKATKNLTCEELKQFEIRSKS